MIQPLMKFCALFRISSLPSSSSNTEPITWGTYVVSCLKTSTWDMPCVSEKFATKLIFELQTYFQTETGCHAFSPLAAVTPTKPGTVALPFFGFNPALIDPTSGKDIEGNEGRGLLVFKQPWPGIARTVWGDHARYMKTYFKEHKECFVSEAIYYLPRMHANIILR